MVEAGSMASFLRLPAWAMSRAVMRAPTTEVVLGAMV